MNKYQQDNIELLDGLAEALGKKVAELDVYDLAQGTSSCMKCVDCGGKVTALNSKFYGNDGTKVKCWNCQHK